MLLVLRRFFGAVMIESLRKKCSYLMFFWSVLFRIWSEYEDLYRVNLRIQPKCRKKQIRNTGTFQAVDDTETRDVGIIFPLLASEITVTQNNARQR